LFLNWSVVVTGATLLGTSSNGWIDDIYI
jgi:hypothetical protein